MKIAIIAHLKFAIVEPLAGGNRSHKAAWRLSAEADVIIDNLERLSLGRLPPNPNAALWNFAAIPNRRVKRQVLPRADN
jgi:hypothetical protein